MKRGTVVGVFGIAATLFVGGTTLLLSNLGSWAVLTGILLNALGFLLPTSFWLADQFTAERRSLIAAVDSITPGLHTYTTRLEEVARQFGLRHDARFIADGFIGLQRHCLLLDQDADVGPERVRMAVFGHLPSYMRLSPLSEQRGRQLYENWEPPHLVAEYVRLVNLRAEALRAFVERGGIVREIYDQAKITQYVQKGWTFHDRVNDPADEISDRLRALLHFLERPNYYICLLSHDEERPGPHFLLKQKTGLVVDLRTTETQKHFTESIDGLYTDSPPVLKQFEAKFALMWRQSEKERVREYLNSLLSGLKHRRVGPPQAEA